MNIDVRKLLEIGIALSGEKDGDRLLTTILTAAMDVAECDGGTLYIIQDDTLAFRVMITKSKGICLGGKGRPIELPPIPLSSDKHVSSCTASIGALINIPDVYAEKRFDFSGTRRYDALNSFKTTSLLCVPMKNDHDEIIGVLQLINAMDENGKIISFAKPLERVIMSLASQAAICLTNMNYAKEITNLFNSFVRVMSTAIDARSPYNANHTRNMVKYGERFIGWLDRTGHEWHFSESTREEFLMSIWLHDVGKLITPRRIMDKESRLGTALREIRHRFEKIALIARIRHLEGKTDERAYALEITALADARSLVEQSNKAPFLTDEALEKIHALGKQTYTDADGKQESYLTEEELTSLLIRKGTLTDSERATMQDHVKMTEMMLSEMSFSHKFRHVPKWASMHHEFANGHGYPHQLSGSALPREVRLLTILDVFDALTARDRPYKKPMPVDKAFAILDEMARDGQVDIEILNLFKQSDAYEEFEEDERGQL